jgi:hypothetical protein
MDSPPILTFFLG